MALILHGFRLRSCSDVALEDTTKAHNGSHAILRIRTVPSFEAGSVPLKDR